MDPDPRPILTDDDYDQLALQCARCAILLLENHGVLHLRAAHLAEALHWKGPHVPDPTSSFLPHTPHPAKP